MKKNKGVVTLHTLTMVIFFASFFRSFVSFRSSSLSPSFLFWRSFDGSRIRASWAAISGPSWLSIDARATVHHNDVIEMLFLFFFLSFFLYPFGSPFFLFSISRSVFWVFFLVFFGFSLPFSFSTFLKAVCVFLCCLFVCVFFSHHDYDVFVYILWWLTPICAMRHTPINVEKNKQNKNQGFHRPWSFLRKVVDKIKIPMTIL